MNFADFCLHHVHVLTNQWHDLAFNCLCTSPLSTSFCRFDCIVFETVNTVLVRMEREGHDDFSFITKYQIWTFLSFAENCIDHFFERSRTWNNLTCYYVISFFSSVSSRSHRHLSFTVFIHTIHTIAMENYTRFCPLYWKLHSTYYLVPVWAGEGGRECRKVIVQ